MDDDGQRAAGRRPLRSIETIQSNPQPKRPAARPQSGRLPRAMGGKPQRGPWYQYPELQARTKGGPAWVEAAEEEERAMGGRCRPGLLRPVAVVLGWDGMVGV